METESMKFMTRIRRFLAAGLLFAVTPACLAQVAETVTYYYTNQQGTPLATADASGNVLTTLDYRPYGNQVLGLPEAGPGYTGHVNDPDSGLVYMQARYYDPVVGRFLSADPSQVQAAIVDKFNRFAYASGNPLTNLDPNGRDTCPGSTPASCRRADTWSAERSMGRTFQVDSATAAAAVAAVGEIQTSARPEQGGYLVQDAKGDVVFKKSENAVAERDSKHDRLNLGPKPKDAVAVEHSHIDGRDRGSASKGLQSDGDASPLTQGLPNIAESLGRAGAWELVGGRLQMRMLDGKMTHTEQLQVQKDLNTEQGQFLKP